MYKCEFPNCEYKTKYKTQVNFHHIVPRELDGSDDGHNLICLCPNHHTRIYIPSATHGMHTVKGEDSIILNGWLNSTKGRILEYVDENGNTQYS